ncbi:transcriptional regulator [Pseudoclavibacter sp. JSM 162008]|uniref:transcriptional regulator n=1 Tax=Pseudoclavibacter sp. JSM 162008 TaxID=3229855 RepID=UPI003524C06F
MSDPSAEFDPIIHAPARLRIMTTLAESLDDGDEMTFSKLRSLLDMTPGNLTTHLSKLEDAGYVVINKAFAGRKPVTYLTISPAGRAAFRSYRTALLKLLGG